MHPARARERRERHDLIPSRFFEELVNSDEDKDRWRKRETRETSATPEEFVIQSRDKVDE